MPVEEDARAAARRIVEEVLADHAARSSPPAVTEGRSSPVVRLRDADHPDTPAWRTARRIVDEVLATHASAHGDTLVASPPNVVSDGETPVDTLDVPTVVIDVSDTPTPPTGSQPPETVSLAPTAAVQTSTIVSQEPGDGFPDELFAEHLVSAEAADEQDSDDASVGDGEPITATAPVDGSADASDHAAGAVPAVEPPPTTEPEIQPGPDVEPAPDDEPEVEPDEEPEPEPDEEPEPEPEPVGDARTDDSAVAASEGAAPDAPVVAGPPAAAPPVSAEAAAVASRIVAEVLAEHAAREAAAAAIAEATEASEVESAVETTEQLPQAAAGPPTDAGQAPAPDETAEPPAVTEQVAVLTGEPSAAQAGVIAPEVLADAPPPVADEVEATEAYPLEQDELASPRRTGRWLLTTLVGAVALAFLFPLAVRALRELISLS